MATNEVYPFGRDLSWEVGPDVVSGTPVRIGIVNGVVIADDGEVSGRKTGNEPDWATVRTQGVFNLEVVLSGAADAGAPVYAVTNGTDATVTLTDDEDSGNNPLFGALHHAGAQGTAVREVLILPITNVTIVEAP